MDYKAIIEAFYALLKDFLKLIGLEEKFNKVEGEVTDILG